MADVISTKSSTQPKTNTNNSITTSGWTAISTGSKIQKVSLTEIQNAVKKLSTYISKVNNCGNCLIYTTVTTKQCSYACQYTKCQSTSYVTVQCYRYDNYYNV